MKGYRIRGRGRPLARLMDRVHTQCDVAGIEERQGEIDVWLRDGSADLPPSGALEVTPLPPPADGAADWRAADRPIAVAEDLLVRPPWVTAPPGFAGIEIVVPRGMAFGSGEHESTQLALQVLHAVIGGRGSFADVGTGSGILALYAHARGCAPIHACDVEADAVAAARALIPGIAACCGGPEALLPHAPFDYVAANLFASELLACAEDLRALWSGRGALVVAGMRHHEAAGVLAALPGEPALVRRGAEFAAAAVTGSRSAR